VQAATAEKEVVYGRIEIPAAPKPEPVSGVLEPPIGEAGPAEAASPEGADHQGLDTESVGQAGAVEQLPADPPAPLSFPDLTAAITRTASDAQTQFISRLPDDAPVLVQIVVSAKTYRGYAVQAAHDDLSVEEKLTERLAETISFTAEKPIYIDDVFRQRIDKMLGRNIGSAEELLTAIQHGTTIECADVQVHIEDNLMRRLKSRLFGRSFAQVVTEAVIYGLKQKVGLV
jgi:hypothetical protein